MSLLSTTSLGLILRYGGLLVWLWAHTAVQLVVMAAGVVPAALCVTLACPAAFEPLIAATLAGQN